MRQVVFHDNDVILHYDIILLANVHIEILYIPFRYSSQVCLTAYTNKLIFNLAQEK